MQVGIGVKQRATTSVLHIEFDADTLECKYRKEYHFDDSFYLHDFAITPNALVIMQTSMQVRSLKNSTHYSY